MSFIGRNDVLGNNQPKRPLSRQQRMAQAKAKKEAEEQAQVSPEVVKAMEFMKSIDTGMTLTRFQIESALAEGEDDSDDFEIYDYMQYILDRISNTEGDRPEVSAVADVLQAIALIVDKMDMDLEDVAKEALK